MGNNAVTKISSEEVEKLINEIDRNEFKNELKNWIKLNYEKIKKFNFDNDVYHTIFSVAKTPDKVYQVYEEYKGLFRDSGKEIPLEQLDLIYRTFYYVVKGYIIFVYFWEKALKDESIRNIKIDKEENLKKFFELLRKDFLRHFRNALAHGSFNIKGDYIEFTDKNFKTEKVVSGEMKFETFEKLSDLFFDFYAGVYDNYEIEKEIKKI